MKTFDNLLRLDFLEREKRLLGFPVTEKEVKSIARFTKFQRFGSEVIMEKGERNAGYGQDVLELVWKAIERSTHSHLVLSGKRVLIKPNLIEARAPTEHVTTHPSIVKAVIRIVKELGAKEVILAEGSGHERDSDLLFKKTGMYQVAREQGVKTVDLNSVDIFEKVINKPLALNQIFLPRILKEVDFVISVPKLKTHHWACVTLSLKNTFGFLPGSVYGFPKNRLHWACIPKVIADINSAINVDLVVMDGIVAMQGNGPLDGEAVETDVVLASEDRLAIDSFATHLMGFSPILVPAVQYSFKKGIGNPSFIFNGDTPRLKPGFTAPPNLKWMEGKGCYSQDELCAYIIHHYLHDLDYWFHRD